MLKLECQIICTCRISLPWAAAAFAGHQTRTYVWRGPCRKHISNPEEVQRLLHAAQPPAIARCSPASHGCTTSDAGSRDEACKGARAAAGPKAAVQQQQRPAGGAATRAGRGTHREQDKQWAALTTWLR